MSNQENEEIMAIVSPRSIGGVSLFEAAMPITADNVREFHSEASDIAAASKELRKLGFKVLHESPVTISIGGSRKLFQEMFGVKLRKQRTEVIPGQEVEFFAVPGEPAEQLLQPPGELTNLIEGMALAEPPIYFQSPSPLPPIVLPDPAAYRYLFVPDEIGLVLNADRVHRMGTTGKGVKVAWPDTGFYRHPFYEWHGYRVKNTVLGPGTTDPTKDDFGHGTAYAANIFATAPDAEMIPIKMAIDAVGAFNVAVVESPQVIACSWGYDIDRPGASLSPYLKTLETAVANAVASGIVVCFAAGGGHYSFPAGHPDVISVGGVHVNYPFRSYADLEASDYASSFDSSLYPGRHVPDLCGLIGKRTSLGAPLYMLPVQPGSTLDLPNTGSTNDGWSIISVISAVSPQVAGVVALMLQKNPSLTPAQVKDRLIKSATDVKVGNSAMGEPAKPGPDAATGAGLVNAKWAYILTMGDVAVQFLEASPEKQAEMLAVGQMPRVSRKFIADLLNTLRSR
jgi:serine protease AprX